jgi:S1-C subfamily serine protease
MPAQRASSNRKVIFGTVPEFGYPGPGVQIASLVPGSPAEKAGLRTGDILIRIDESELPDLRTFSEILKTLRAGQSVEAVFLREREEQTARVTVEAR